MSVDNSRIAKNTVYLYIRMLFVLGAGGSFASASCGNRVSCGCAD